MIFNVVFINIISTFYEPFLLVEYYFNKKIFSWMKVMAQNYSWNILPDMLYYSSYIFITNLNGAWKPAIKNWPNGKLLSTFDSDNIKIPIYPLNCWKRRFSLFFRELILRCPNIYPLILLTRISLSLLCS